MKDFQLCKGHESVFHVMVKMLYKKQEAQVALSRSPEKHV